MADQRQRKESLLLPFFNLWARRTIAIVFYCSLLRFIAHKMTNDQVMISKLPHHFLLCGVYIK
jgi:hypothetical protein